jgi:hypothetical protein
MKVPASWARRKAAAAKPKPEPKPKKKTVKKTAK